MKTLPVVATLVTCFLLCGFQQEASSSQREPAPQVGSADKQRADSGKTTRGPAPPTQSAPDAADKNATSAAGPRENDKVEVTALPPEIAIKQIRDSIDCTILYCTIILTIVGVVGMSVGVWTLLAIKDQARTLHEHSEELWKLAEAAWKNAGAAEENAEAARLNAQALINAERPWVMVQTEVLLGDNPAIAEFKLSAFNYGKSPAHITACNGPKVEVVELSRTLPIPPEYGVWEWDNRFLAPKDSIPLRDAVKPWEAYKTALREVIANGGTMPKDSYVIVYGIIEYSDGVSGQVYKTAYCYTLKRNKLSDMGGTLIPIGPPEYNAYT
jgi:hypothetical protein